MKSTVKGELVGLEQLAEKLKVTVQQVRTAAETTVYAQTIALVDLINRNYMVPVKSGRLRASTYVTLPEWNEGMPTCEIGYAAPYASEVHERGTPGKGYKVGGPNQRKGRPQWLARAKYLWSMSYMTRFQASFRKYIMYGTTPQQLVGIVPTTPTDYGANGGTIKRHQKRYGHTQAEKKKLMKMRRLGAIALVGWGHRKREKKKAGRPKKK